MEILLKSASLILLATLLGSPILILLKLKKVTQKNIFIKYLILATLISSVLAIVFGWWSDQSNNILLSHYGYNFDAMNDIERYKNVQLLNMEKVKKIEISIMGIGWPLKVIMSYIYYFPYLLILYVITYFYDYFKNIKSS